MSIDDGPVDATVHTADSGAVPEPEPARPNSDEPLPDRLLVLARALREEAEICGYGFHIYKLPEGDRTNRDYLISHGVDSV